MVVAHSDQSGHQNSQALKPFQKIVRTVFMGGSKNPRRSLSPPRSGRQGGGLAEILQSPAIQQALAARRRALQREQEQTPANPSAGNASGGAPGQSATPQVAAATPMDGGVEIDGDDIDDNEQSVDCSVVYHITHLWQVLQVARTSFQSTPERQRLPHLLPFFFRR